MITSQTIQNIRLTYHHNPVKQCRAVVFVTTELIGRDGQPTLLYKDARKRGARLVEMYGKFLKIENVEVITDATKAEMIAKFDELQAEADRFDKENADSSIAAFFINFVGFKLSWSNNTQ